ncbi:MAG: hypothetical protein Q8914_01905 [Bacteroidota bacterium]|nr:hypothetical protein [Bacteroidota bacterium]
MQPFKKIRFICLLSALILAGFHVNADENTATNTATAIVSLGVTEVSLLKASEGIVMLQLGQQEAGMSMETAKSDSTMRLLISSVISSSATRTLTAKITAGAVPTGTHLDVVALQPNASFVGGSGTFASPTSLDGTDRPIVTGIATCYSGTEPSDGYPLKFTYAIDLNSTAYGSIRATAGTQIVVTFTLTAVQ